MKNKNLIITIAVIIILLIGGGLYLGMKKDAAPSQAPQPENKTMTSDNTGNKLEQVEGSLKSLITGGKSLTCTFSNNLNDTSSINGTVYTSGGKVREDFQSTSAQVKVSGHVIIESENGYMWTDQNDQGFKFAINGQPTPASTHNQTPDIDKAMKFSCQPWNVDSSLFNLPSNITFQTMTIPAAPPSGAMQRGLPNSTNMCAVCNNIPEGPNRESCKAQLKCP